MRLEEMMDDRKIPSSPDHDTTKTKLTSRKGMKNFTSELSNLLGPDKNLSQDLKFLKTLNKSKVSVKAPAKSSKSKSKPKPVKKKKTPVASVQKSTPVPQRSKTLPEHVVEETMIMLGNPKTFIERADYDPYASSKDTAFKNLCKNGGEYIRQPLDRYRYDSWDQAARDQSSEWKWEIWLDPSAPATIIHPADAVDNLKKPGKIVKGKCPTKLNLGKEFGEDVEFIYLSPPWNDPNWGGDGTKGYFTVDHLKKLDLDFQTRGFVFMWLPFTKIQEILAVMEAKEYKIADTTAAVVTKFDGTVSGTPRHPGGDPRDHSTDGIAGRMCGSKFHGFLFKKMSKSKERFRIGNQIIVDTLFLKQKLCPHTGQQLMDHGYVYQMYQYLIVEKPKTQCYNAIHLFCLPNLKRTFWGGVQHFGKMEKA